ncbi:MAG: Double zinc ribbon [Actinobacteria bacterium ADurb.Bin346]|nr:MAG: Double zinc ribbon [Actinobacteria bacterium ADurb.Bin346]
MAKQCVECGKEIKEETDSPYCAKCDEMLDKKFESIEDNIMIYKELMGNEITILNKFEKEDIVELYVRVHDKFKEEGAFTEEQAKVLNQMISSFGLTGSDVGKERIVEYKEGAHVKKIDKDKCPDCGKNIKEDFNLCPYCGYRLKL